MENTNVTEQSTNEIMPMAASGETNFASLTEKTTPASGDMFLMEDSEDTKKINYDKLADAILNKLTSKTYSGLETTAKNFVTAINELNSKSKGYILGITVTSTDTLKFKGRFDSNTLGNGDRQSVLMFGDANASTVHGVLRIYGNGTVQWRGYAQSGEVTASMDSKGIISVNLPEVAYDTFCLVSAQRITAV